MRKLKKVNSTDETVVRKKLHKKGKNWITLTATFTLLVSFGVNTGSQIAFAAENVTEKAVEIKSEEKVSGTDKNITQLPEGKINDVSWKLDEKGTLHFSQGTLPLLDKSEQNPFENLIEKVTNVSFDQKITIEKNSLVILQNLKNIENIKGLENITVRESQESFVNFTNKLTKLQNKTDVLQLFAENEEKSEGSSKSVPVKEAIKKDNSSLVTKEKTATTEVPSGVSAFPRAQPTALQAPLPPTTQTQEIIFNKTFDLTQGKLNFNSTDQAEIAQQFDIAGMAERLEDNTFTLANSGKENATGFIILNSDMDLSEAFSMEGAFSFKNTWQQSGNKAIKNTFGNDGAGFLITNNSFNEIEKGRAGGTLGVYGLNHTIFAGIDTYNNSGGDVDAGKTVLSGDYSKDMSTQIITGENQTNFGGIVGDTQSVLKFLTNFDDSTDLNADTSSETVRTPEAKENEVVAMTYLPGNNNTFPNEDKKEHYVVSWVPLSTQQKDGETYVTGTLTVSFTGADPKNDAYGEPTRTIQKKFTLDSRSALGFISSNGAKKDDVQDSVTKLSYKKSATTVQLVFQDKNGEKIEEDTLVNMVTGDTFSFNEAKDDPNFILNLPKSLGKYTINDKDAKEVGKQTATGKKITFTIKSTDKTKDEIKENMPKATLLYKDISSGKTIEAIADNKEWIDVPKKQDGTFDLEKNPNYMPLIDFYSPEHIKSDDKFVKFVYKDNPLQSPDVFTSNDKYTIDWKELKLKPTGMFNNITVQPVQAKGNWGTAHWYIDMEGTLHIGAGTGGKYIEKYIGGEKSGTSFFNQWKDIINKVSFDQPQNFYFPEDSSYMFDELYNVTEYVGLGEVHTENVIKMNLMFSDNKSVTELPGIDEWKTPKVTEFSYMFQNTIKLNKLNLNEWDTKNVTSLISVFENSGIQELQVSEWNTENVTNILRTFLNAQNLKELDLSNWKTKKEGVMVNIFDGMKSLTKITFGKGFESLIPTKLPNTKDTEKWRNTTGSIWTDAYSGKPEDADTYVLGPKVEDKKITVRYLDETNEVLKEDLTFPKGATSIDYTKLDMYAKEQGAYISKKERTINGMQEKIGTVTNPRDEDSIFKNYVYKDDPYQENSLQLQLKEDKRIELMEVQAKGIFGTVKWYLDMEGTLHVSGGEFPEAKIKESWLELTNDVGPWNDVREQIKNIVFEGKLDPKQTISGLFKNSPNLTSIKGLENIDVSQVQSFSQTFMSIPNLTSLDLSGWVGKTGNVLDMGNMFTHSYNLKEITGLGDLDTSKVESFYYMFFNTSSLEVLDMHNWNTENIKAGKFDSMIGGNHQPLWKIIFGKNFNITPQLPNTNDTTKWRNVAGGTDENPQGDNWFDAYSGDSKDADTYVLGPKPEDPITNYIPMTGSKDSAWLLGILTITFMSSAAYLGYKAKKDTDETLSDFKDLTKK